MLKCGEPMREAAIIAIRKPLGRKDRRKQILSNLSRIIEITM